jgi:septum formation protein
MLARTRENPSGPDLVLASSSPRRADLLTRLGARFRVRASDVDEGLDEPDPARLVEVLARRKAEAVSRLEPGVAVLGADTVVALEGRVLGKPRDRAENAAYLQALSGRWHEVHTGLALLGPGLEAVGAERTRVRFRQLTEAEVEGYALSGEGLDKAGGYGIQERGMALVERIEGDYFNVVGLPVALLLELARRAGLELLPWAAIRR